MYIIIGTWSNHVVPVYCILIGRVLFLFLFCFLFLTSLKEDTEGEELHSTTSEDNVLDETREGTYLRLEEMGVFLSYLASNGIYHSFDEYNFIDTVRIHGIRSVMIFL